MTTTKTTATRRDVAGPGEIDPRTDTRERELHNTAANAWSPRVCDGCHTGFNGDRYPNKVRKVSPSGKTVWVSSDDYRVIDGEGGFVEGPRGCIFSPGTAGDPSTWRKFMKQADGTFRARGGRRGELLIPGRAYSSNPHV